MMDDYGNGNDGVGNGAGNSSSNNQWPTSTADIVEYDSSLAPDTPTLQQQQSQFLLPQQQQRTKKLLQNAGTSVKTHSNAGYGGKSTIISAAAEDSVNGGSHSNFKWKTRALYAFLVCLLAVVIINLTLTLWFIRVTQFTSVICYYYNIIISVQTCLVQFIRIHYPDKNYFCFILIRYELNDSSNVYLR